MFDILKKMIDISVTLSDETIIYPGDPTPEYGLIFSLDNGEIANVGCINHGIHHGTHVDVPYHFKNGIPYPFSYSRFYKFRQAWRSYFF
jgi:kynurenine formamidase